MVRKIRVQTNDGSALVTLLERHKPATCIDEYDLLIEAICRQAARDLKSKVYKHKVDALDFFRSRWCEHLTELDGEEILQQLLRRD